MPRAAISFIISISMSNQQSFRVGFWLGDASLEYGGIGPYALRVLTSLLEDYEPGWHFVLLCDAAPPEKLKSTLAQFPGVVDIRLIPSAPTNEHPLTEQARELDAISNSRFGPDAQTLPIRSNYLKHWLEGLDLDLLHFPTQTILHRDLQIPYSLTMHGVEELPHVDPGVPFIVTMHDVQELHFPENFTPHQRATRAVHYWKAMEKAGKVIVSFDHVKEDLIKFFGLSPDKIRVCPIPFRSISFREPTPDASRSYSEKYDESRPFLLYPSHTWRHKNHIQLLRALKEVQRRYVKNLRLICTGGINHHYHAEVLVQVAALGLNDSVLFTGIVPEDELCWLYRHAALVTIPTKYEAGSFPLFEAILLGVPVICSDVTSLPETIGDRRFVFDPDDVEALSSLIYRMISDARFRQDNISNSIEQAQRLRQINAAAHFYQTYRSLLYRPSPC
jgi:glycosyltransferase involved in cell wall biosynthesis